VLTFPYLGRTHRRSGQGVGYKPLDYGARNSAWRGVPVIALAGNLHGGRKNSGGIRHQSPAPAHRGPHRGTRFKATGVSPAPATILAFEDSGARRTMIFTDLGIVTTTEKMRSPRPDADHVDRDGERAARCHRFRIGRRSVGLLRECNRSCWMPPSNRRSRAVVLSANDPGCSLGAASSCCASASASKPAAVTGPATDNLVGIEIIREQMKRRGIQRHQQPRRSGRLPHCQARDRQCRRAAQSGWGVSERGRRPSFLGRHRIRGPAKLFAP